MPAPSEASVIDSIVKLDKRYDISAFSCSEEPLNKYLKDHAWASQQGNGAVVYLALSSKKKVIGYYSLVYGSVNYADAPDRMKKGLQRPAIPIMLLARLAVDQQWENKGIGSELLINALERSIEASSIAGLRAVIVDAKNESARGFYVKYNFELLSREPLRLFLMMKDIKATFNA